MAEKCYFLGEFSGISGSPSSFDVRNTVVHLGILRLTQELDKYQQDDIEIGTNMAICSVRSTIDKLTTCEEGKNSQVIFKRLQFILCQLENFKI